MTDHFLARRLIQISGLVFLGDGLMGLLNSKRHSLVWHAGPELAKAISEEIADHPTTARTVNLVKVALGAVLLVYAVAGEESTAD